MPSSTCITLSRLLSAPVADAYNIVVEIERFPEFMENVNSIKILSAEGTRKVIAWEMTIDDAPLDWIEEVNYDAHHHRVEFCAIDGVFERFDGYWQVFPMGSGSKVELQLEYELGLPEIEHIIGPILKSRLMANLETMLASIESRGTSR
jgi:coenzyme Q-binding protein COQ10